VFPASRIASVCHNGKSERNRGADPLPRFEPPDVNENVVLSFLKSFFIMNGLFRIAALAG